MFADRPLSIAVRRRGLPAGSPPPARAATLISRMILVKILPRLASVAFLRPSIDGPLPMSASGRVHWRGGDFTRLGAIRRRSPLVRHGCAEALSAGTARAGGTRPPGAPPRPKTAGRCGWPRSTTWSASPGQPGFVDRHGAVVVAREAAEQLAQAERQRPAIDADLGRARPSAPQPCCSRPALRPSGMPRSRRQRANPAAAALPHSGEPRQTTRRTGRRAHRCSALHGDQAAEAVREHVGVGARCSSLDQARHAPLPARRRRWRSRRYCGREPGLRPDAPPASASTRAASTGHAAGRRAGSCVARRAAAG